MKRKIKPYIISVLIALAVGALSAFLTRDSMDIYREVTTPPLSPPSILFPIVWTALYILMGVSAAIVFLQAASPRQARENALTVYGASLIFNFAWSIIFFSLRAYLVAFVWLLALLGLILKTVIDYFRINKTAAYLQIPYTLWVAFAGYLNLGIWWLNK